MEENANVVVKLLIRRPECFGPALRGEGGQGLLVAMKEAIKISEDPTLDLPKIPEGVSARYETFTLCRSVSVTSLISQSQENFNSVHCSSGEEGGEIIHMGNAIMSFYSALIDLLGRCAPEMHVRISMTTVMR